ncbi:MAG: hypothetical protein WDN00_06775 [Limisphaerales bacterium]
MEEFFGCGIATKLAGENRQADLILGNNVFAHAPDTNDFVAGLKKLLKPEAASRWNFPTASSSSSTTSSTRSITSTFFISR